MELAGYDIEELSSISSIPLTQYAYLSTSPRIVTQCGTVRYVTVRVAKYGIILKYNMV